MIVFHWVNLFDPRVNLRPDTPIRIGWSHRSQINRHSWDTFGHRPWPMLNRSCSTDFMIHISVDTLTTINICSFSILNYSFEIMCKNHINSYLSSYNNRGGSMSIDKDKYLFSTHVIKSETDSVAFLEIQFAELIRSRGVCFLRPSQFKLEQQ